MVHFAVSMGRDIYLGLKYIVQGAEYVLRQALHTIEEVAVAIGSVLAAIGRIVTDVIEGLSLIFHLDKVLAVANMIKQRIATMTANLVTLIGDAAPTVDNLFATAEAEIDGAFSSIVSSLEGAAGGRGTAPAATNSIGGLNGMGATPNTIFAVGPGHRETSSQAVPAMWGVHKLRQNIPGVPCRPAAPTPTARSPPSSQNFGASLLDRQLQQQLQCDQERFSRPGAFRLRQGLFCLAAGRPARRDRDAGGRRARLCPVPGRRRGRQCGRHRGSDGRGGQRADSGLVGNLAGAHRLAAHRPGRHRLCGRHSGHADLPDRRGRVSRRPTGVGSWSSAAQLVWQRVEGIAATVNTVLYGLFSAISDARECAISGGELTVLATLLGVAISLGVAFDLVVGDVLTPEVWVVVASIIGLVLLLLNAIPSLPSEIPSFTGVALSPLLLVAYCQEYAADPDALSLASDVVGALPTIVNPIKFAPLTTAAPLVAPVADVACALAAAGLTLGNTIGHWDSADDPTGLPEVQEPLPGAANRVFMPAVLQGQ